MFYTCYQGYKRPIQNHTIGFGAPLIMDRPCTIVDSQKVLGIYNQEHVDEEDMQKVTQKVQDWFKEKSEKNGWDEVSFSGGQCILKNNFTK